MTKDDFLNKMREKLGQTSFWPEDPIQMENQKWFPTGGHWVKLSEQNSPGKEPYLTGYINLAVYDGRNEIVSVGIDDWVSRAILLHLNRAAKTVPAFNGMKVSDFCARLPMRMGRGKAEFVVMDKDFQNPELMTGLKYLPYFSIIMGSREHRSTVIFDQMLQNVGLQQYVRFFNLGVQATSFAVPDEGPLTFRKREYPDVNEFMGEIIAEAYKENIKLRGQKVVPKITPRTEGLVGKQLLYMASKLATFRKEKNLFTTMEDIRRYGPKPVKPAIFERMLMPPAFDEPELAIPEFD